MTNLVSAEHLEALAAAAKNYTKNEISKGGVSAAPFILDTVPSTVEGAVWLDESSDEKLVIYHNNQRYYFPLSVLPQITDLTITPPTLAAMQGQSATATVTALANEQVTGLSYSLENPPTWITISDDVILIQPSDNDLGQAVVQVYARDTGSDASASAPFVAEALLRPIIESLYVIPPAVTVQQGQSATAGISAVANAAVTGLSFSLNGASSWVSLNGDVIEMNPTDNDLGDNTVNVVAFDTNSSASAATQFVATAALRPIINAVIANPNSVTVNQGQSAFVTLSADANAAVTGLSYSLANAPTWMTLGGDVITIAPTDNDLGSVTVTATARDINSSAEASTTFVAAAEAPSAQINDISITPAALNTTVDGTKYATLTADVSGNAQISFRQLEGAEKSWITVAADGLATLKPTAVGMATAGTHSLQVEAYGGGATFVKTFLVNVSKATATLSTSPTSYILYSGSGTGNDYPTVKVNTNSDGKINVEGTIPSGSVMNYDRSTRTLTFAFQRKSATIDPTKFSTISANSTTARIRVKESSYYYAPGTYTTYTVKNVIANSDNQYSINWTEP